MEQVKEGFDSRMREKLQRQMKEEAIEKDEHIKLQAYERQRELAYRKREIKRNSEHRKAQTIN